MNPSFLTKGVSGSSYAIVAPPNETFYLGSTTPSPNVTYYLLAFLADGSVGLI